MSDLRQDPVMNAIHKGIRRGIDLTIENNCLGSAVILILSAIDAMAYISMPEGQENVERKDFIAWSEKYIQFAGTEQLSGADLYGARCAMLHSYGATSRMSRQGECRMIAYMDRSNPPIRYRPEASKELVFVSVPALRDAVFRGIDQFLIDTYKDPKSKQAQLADTRLQTLVQ